MSKPLENAKPLKISVVVPAFNEEKLIGATLASLRAAMTAFAERQWSYELIVCDNNSTDRTAELAKAAGAVVAFEPINQIARARNKGAEAATGDWLVFVDADSHPSAALFSEMADAIQTGKYVFGGCTLQMEGATGLPKLVTNIWNLVSRSLKYAAGSFIFCETAAFRSIGGFDNRLFVSEELDLSKRLKKFAKACGKKAIILRKNPMVTSGRKLHLYSHGEHLRFMLRAFLGWNRVLQNRDECHIWYDGRR